MTIYSVCLARFAGTGPVNDVIYTAPSEGVVVVRDVSLMHTGTASRHLSLYSLSGSLAVFVASGYPFVAYEAFHWSGRQVLDPGEVLKALSDSDGSVYCRVSGYILGL